MLLIKSLGFYNGDYEVCAMTKYVKDIMNNNIKTVDKHLTVKSICKIMAKEEIGSLVVTESDKIIGIISERDIVKKVCAKGVNPDEITAEDIMTKNVKTIGADQSLIDASILMADNKIKRLLVEENGNIIGIITLTALNRERFLMDIRNINKILRRKR